MANIKAQPWYIRFSSETAEGIADLLVENGKITREQADYWLENSENIVNDDA